MAATRKKGLAGGSLGLIGGASPSPSTSPAAPATEQPVDVTPQGDSNRNHHGGTTAQSPQPASGGVVTGGIIGALRRGDDQTGTRVLRIPLDQVAPHPENPRESLGDLAGLAESMKEVGQLQPGLVVTVDQFVAEHPDWRDHVQGYAWVATAGHRRRAAAELAGLDHFEAIAKPDADKISTYVTFLAENIHRAGLNAIEEARALQLMADAGLSQRAIAAKSGIAQGQVSKRLSLLKLPEEVQSAITGGAVSPTDALALTGIPADEQAEVWRLAQREQITLDTAVRRVERDRAARLVAIKAREEAERNGVPLVEDPHKEWAHAASRHRIYSDEQIETARASGDLRAHPTSNGIAYYSAAPVGSDDRPPAPDDAAEKRERTAAMKARTEAAGQLVQKQPTAGQATSALVDLTLFNYGNYADCLRLVHKWLGERLGKPSDSMYTWCESLAHADSAQQRWAAWAMTVASAEVQARYTNTPWRARQRDYLAQLVREVGYQPTPWEQARLDRIPAASKENDR
ncbi:ParB/RepB/Spo0J family partition protein [Pimelobacter sp. 30-1]|uniref:ParB/RepB/Spo0J family partition protein n=1 Tax=Pimelobacter sp. 30-1 TaxID=2004991 RepID=UPI001C04A3AC|nr:ParB/RepB/Spo0J family partition protein [Pimelobacter sp. 30-1]MBU2698907.1 hypothetical protein [Pimelobacter sp. 30-1]